MPVMGQNMQTFSKLQDNTRNTVEKDYALIFTWYQSNSEFRSDAVFLEWGQLLWLEVQWATKQDFILQIKYTPS